MSSSESDTKPEEQTQSKYNTRKRKLSEEKDSKEIDNKETGSSTKNNEKNVKKPDDESIEKRETKKVKSKSENAEATPSVSATNEDNAEVQDKVVTRSRKRKLSEEDDGDVQPETSRKRKEVEKKTDKEIIKKRRVTKSECICATVQKKPDYSADKDASIRVEEWRLESVQSPIELKHEDSNEYNNFPPLDFHGHWDNEGKASVTNNGYTATLTFTDREVPFLVGGPLHEDTYVFEQLHFHWSDDDHSGCEHIFEGKAYSMEAHAVHYNSRYKSFNDAVDKHDGLAVVAFFLQATDDFENECFKKLSEAVKDIIKINSSTSVRPDCLTWIKDAANCKGYYTYQGSLTTQPYFESVTWIIYPKPIHISQEQVQNYRNMQSTPCEQYTITNNVRPVQVPQKKLDIFYARSHKVEA